MTEKIKLYADYIRQIIENTEELQDSHESEYTKRHAKITAYNEILELIRGNNEQ